MKHSDTIPNRLHHTSLVSNRYVSGIWYRAPNSPLKAEHRNYSSREYSATDFLHPKPERLPLESRGAIAQHLLPSHPVRARSLWKRSFQPLQLVSLHQYPLRLQCLSKVRAGPAAPNKLVLRLDAHKIEKQFRHVAANQVAEGLPWAELPVTSDRPLGRTDRALAVTRAPLPCRTATSGSKTGSYLFSQLKGPDVA